MRWLLGAAGGVLVLFVGAWWYFSHPVEMPPPVVDEIPAPVREEIGQSVEGRVIEAYTYGTGDTHLVFVGGIHGGYEWNSVALAYQFLDYLDANPSFVPENTSVTVIPSANPDGVFAVVGTEGRFTLADVSGGDQSPGRFNANDVDLNRNFDCKWQSEGTWRGNAVSTGDRPFSEPEAQALRDFFLREQPDVVVFWHSQAGAVYGSECEEGILPSTLAIVNAYAEAGGYQAVPAFDSYPVTGDAEGWLASIGIPAISVELTTHEAIEWNKNLKGITALLRYFDQQSGQGR